MKEKEKAQILKKIQPKKERIKPEPKYVSEDEIFGDDDSNSLKRPKWQKPATVFQKEFLGAVGRLYYATKNDRSAVIAIEKSRLYLESGLISVYPAEWVDTCINWVIKKRKEGYYVQLTGLINLINDKDKRIQFIAKWQKDHPAVKLRQQISEDDGADHQEEEWKKYLG